MAQKYSSFKRLLTTLTFVFFIASVISYEISSSKFSGAASKSVAGKDKKDADVYEMLELFGILDLNSAKKEKNQQKKNRTDCPGVRYGKPIRFSSLRTERPYRPGFHRTAACGGVRCLFFPYS